ncbi:hypothetical protein [Citrobacter portucalensis]|uniref:hypothetical protein n=1 Tax=Citrobacter portucalensis TaxID=1639133 RepID=UPI002B2513EA|nr:hypothetical protein [Citrobacter portucalensis]MEB1052780.1 hypothetical protein [Citrobacter portucalensis]
MGTSFQLDSCNYLKLLSRICLFFLGWCITFLSDIMLCEFYILLSLTIFYFSGNRFLFLSLSLFSAYTLFPLEFSRLGGLYFDMAYDSVLTSSFFAVKMLVIFLSFMHISQVKTNSVDVFFNALLRSLKKVNGIKLLLIHFIALICGSISLIQFVANGQLYDLRDNKDILFFAQNQYYQIIFIPIALILLVKALKNKFEIIYLVMLLLPFLLSASRKEIFVLACAFYLTYPKIIAGKRKIWLVFFALTMFLSPMFREGVGVYDRFVSFHEFILPQYGLIISQSIGIDGSYFPNSNFLSGFWALIPSFLRLSDYITIGNQLSQLNIGNIGLASTPALDAYINFGILGIYIYPIFIFLYYKVCMFIISRRLVQLSPFLFYFIVFGRSELWLTIFFSLYTSLFFLILLAKKDRGDFNDHLY